MKKILICIIALAALSLFAGCSTDNPADVQESSVTKEEMEKNDILSLYSTYLPGSVLVKSIETGNDMYTEIDDMQTISELWNELCFQEWKRDTTEEPASESPIILSFSLPGSKGEVVLYTPELAKAGDEIFELPDDTYEKVRSLLKDVKSSGNKSVSYKKNSIL